MSGDSENDPLVRFGLWLAEAEAAEPNDPNAMTLATADAAGIPSARMVLLKGVDAGGFVFYTNLESHKGRDLAENPHAALIFHWKSLRRQVRVEPVTGAEADAYFASRHRSSRIGAWASDQSRTLDGRFELEKRVAVFAAKFGIGDVPRPSHWSGYRVIPNAIEFWEDRPFRLHDRLLFERDGDSWTTRKLFP